MRDYLDDYQIKVRGSASTSPVRLFLLALALALLSIALMYGDQIGWLAPIRGTLEHGASPIVRTFTNARATLADLWYGGNDIERLRSENDLLREQVRQMQAEKMTYQQTLIQNRQLRQQLAIQAENPWLLLDADILVRSPDAGRRVLTIARGQKDGVAVGMAVVGQTESSPTALVGIVDAVGPHTASVLLINDFGSRISARVLLGEDSALGLVTGQWQYGSQLYLEQLDRSLPLQEKAVVVSAGLTGNLGLPLPLASVPAGIPIGTIEHVISGDSFTLAAEVAPIADPDKVRDVWVVLSYKD
jgi:rod shape-determining protein MreC